jgi:hypothetical protein
MKPAIERGEKCYNARLTEEQVRLARIYVMQGPVGVLPQLARQVGCRHANAAQCSDLQKLEAHPTAYSRRDRCYAVTKLGRNCWQRNPTSTLRAMRPLGPQPWLHYGDT